LELIRVTEGGNFRESSSLAMHNDA